MLSFNLDDRALEEGDLDMAAAKKEYLENKQREFRSYSFLGAFTTNSSLVRIGRSSRTKRRATGGPQDGLCLQNHLLLERTIGGQQETFGRRISQDLLKSFRYPGFRKDRSFAHNIPWRHPNTCWSTFPGVWGCNESGENLQRVRLVPIYGSVDVQQCCMYYNPIYGDNQESFPCFSSI